MRLTVSIVQPHPGKRSPCTSATSQTSFNFHLPRNVVGEVVEEGGQWAIYRNLLYFFCQDGLFPQTDWAVGLFHQASLKEVARRLTLSKHPAPAQATVEQFQLDDLLSAAFFNLGLWSISALMTTTKQRPVHTCLSVPTHTTLCGFELLVRLFWHFHIFIDSVNLKTCKATTCTLLSLCVFIDSQQAQNTYANRAVIGFC